ncbi:MAG: 50S ribosomal protein L32 [Parcubacteria group bacterium]|nr:50S ribosomal protein L32 [Parcubacteria group bacterium]
MALPGHRHTSSKRKRRASHFALKTKATTTCSECKAPRVPHHACSSCGSYRGRKV